MMIISYKTQHATSVTYYLKWASQIAGRTETQLSIISWTPASAKHCFVWVIFLDTHCPSLPLSGEFLLS